MTIATKDKTKPRLQVSPWHLRPKLDPPPLENGDRLSRAEFERRYEAMPHVKKAELIEGVVFMSSPVHFASHGNPQANLIGWLATYCAITPGVSLADNTSVRLDSDTEVQPDILLRLDEALGGTSRVSYDDYLEGPPELVVEIAASSASYDLNDKKRAYQKNGVQEYLVWRVYNDAVDWFYLQNGLYQKMVLNEDGLLCSQIFPGLHLDVNALLHGYLAEVLAVVRAGTETEAHAAFVASFKD